MADSERAGGAVRRIARGYLFLDLNLYWSSADLLPDWIGGWMILQSLPPLAKRAPSLRRLRPLWIGLTLWYAVKWIAETAGVTGALYGPDMAAAVVSLYLHFQLLTGLAELAQTYDCFQSKALLKLRTVQVILRTGVRLAEICLAANRLGEYGGADWRTAAGWVILLIQLGLLIKLRNALFSLARTMEKNSAEG